MRESCKTRGYAEELPVKKIYLIQPTYRDRNGRRLRGKRLFLHSLALPALAATVPPDWEKEVCLEYFDEIDFETEASVVGISCMVCDIFHARELAQEFKKRGKHVIVGGCSAPLWKEVVRPWADTLVFGNPGPDDMARILADTESDTLEPEYHFGMNVDFPFDYTALEGKRITFMPVLSSVGCRNRCEFCATATMLQGCYRNRSIDAVMADLRAASRTTRRVAFVDTNFYNSRSHVLEICTRMIEEGLDLFWGAECTLSVGDDLEVLRALRQAGCQMLFIGIESVNEAGIRDMRKPNVVSRYRQQLQNIRDAGILVAGFFIVGLDGDRREIVDELFAFIRETGVSVPLVNLLTPIPGTTLFDRLKREGRITMEREVEFLQQNLLYNTPMYRCYYRPEPLTPLEAEWACLELRERLFSLREILRRSLVASPILSYFLLTMNLRLLAETRAIRKALRAEHGEARATGLSHSSGSGLVSRGNIPQLESLRARGFGGKAYSRCGCRSGLRLGG
jgi:radical SAM superfamily enzyme YgiQ (UPF0313 family)